MKIETGKEVKLKNGIIVPHGTNVNSFNREYPYVCTIEHLGIEYKVKVTSVFHAPDEKELEEMAFDSTCYSVLGETVELDGWDEWGSPSWLLALGLI